MSTVTPTAPVTGSPWLRAASGGGAVAAVAVAARDLRPWHMNGELWTVALLVAAMVTLSWARPLVLYRNGRTRAYQFDEGFFAVLALLAPPPLTLGVLAVAVAVGHALRRRSPAEAALAVGRVLLASSAGLVVARSVGVPSRPLSVAAVLGVVLGSGVYMLVGGALAWAGDGGRARIEGSLREDLLTQGALSSTAVLVGILLALDVRMDRWATALAVPVLILLRLLVTAQFHAHHDRSRLQGLFDVTLDANRRLRPEAVLDSVLQAARDQLRCTDARFATDGPAEAEMAAALEIGGRPHWLVVAGRGRDDPFGPSDRILLEAIAAIARGALTNAELYRQVRYERGRLASITLNMGEGVCAVDMQGNLTFVNPAAAGMIRLQARSVAVADAMPRDAMRAPEFLLGPAREAMAAGGVVRREDARFDGPDGRSLPVAFSASAIRQAGEVVGAVISFRDITERKKLEATMTHQALYDSLTGLANRRMLVDRLDAALQRSRTDGSVHALIFIDVDRFKAVNDSLGHGTGDGLLTAVGNRMKHLIGPRTVLSRFGGDEFVILIEDVADAEAAVSVARRICKAAEVPLVLPDGYELVAGLSIGVALTEPGQSADDALRDADVAMYRAKGQGGTYKLFDKAQMGTRSSKRIDLESALRKGIERGELELHYQPLVAVEDQRIIGAEALVRWRHPTEGLIPPDRFIPMAEETGLILPLGAFVLEEACRRIHATLARLGVELPLSLNLSPRQFQQSTLLAEIAAALDQAGLPSRLLKFELTETMVMDDLAGAAEIMKKLNRLGVRLAIDDFGTGHSSLGYLKNFPVHEVKVDRIFVENLDVDPVDAAIVRAVVDLSRAMGIDAVAEGVETAEQLAALRRVGCQSAQGYYFSRPLPSAQFDALLDDRFGATPRPRVVRVG